MNQLDEGAESSAPTRVRLQAREFDLELPASYTIRQEVLLAVRSNALRAHGAALGVCVPTLQKRLKIVYQGDPLAFGAAILDGLVEAGVPEAQVRTAAMAAFVFLVDRVLPLAEAKAAEDFFGATPAPSSST